MLDLPVIIHQLIHAQLFIHSLDAVMCKRWFISVEIVHLIFVQIIMTKYGIEDETGDKSRDGNASVHPQELGIHGNGDQSFRDGRTEGISEKVQTLDERLHGRRSLGVSILKTGDGDEDLGKTNEDVSWSLDSDVDVVGKRGVAILASRAFTGVLVARSSLVDQMLNNGCVSEAERSQPEADGDTHYGS